MNKVILMGRLTRDPEVKYTQSAEPLAVARFSIAVNRRYKREGEAEADFINCVAFGKTGEFTSKYFKKGMMIGLVGRLQVNSYTDRDGKKRTSTDVIVEEQYFTGSKAENIGNAGTPAHEDNDFYQVEEATDDDLPF